MLSRRITIVVRVFCEDLHDRGLRKGKQLRWRRRLPRKCLAAASKMFSVCVPDAAAAWWLQVYK